MVIAEVAVAIGAAVIVMLALLSTIAAALVHVRLQDAARAGARSAARGDSTADVVDAAKESAPQAHVTVERDDPVIRVTATSQVRVLPLFPTINVAKTAVARTEESYAADR